MTCKLIVLFFFPIFLFAGKSLQKQILDDVLKNGLAVSRKFYKSIDGHGVIKILNIEATALKYYGK